MHARGAYWSFHKMTVLGSEWLNNHVLSNSLRTEEYFHEDKGGGAPTSSKKTKEWQAKICIKWQYYRVWMNEKPRRKQFIPLLSRCRREKIFLYYAISRFCYMLAGQPAGFYWGKGAPSPSPSPVSTSLIYSSHSNRVRMDEQSNFRHFLPEDDTIINCGRSKTGNKC